MDTSEPGTQGNQAESAAMKLTIQQIKGLTAHEFPAWVQKELSKPLDAEDLEALKKAKINGDTFLRLANNWNFFQEGCKLSAGPSFSLATLAGEIAGDAVGTRSKLLSFVSCTPRRQQTDNVTGNRQQAEDVEMTAADSAGKSTDHAPLLFSLH
jgi:hypothetical protein